MSARLPARPAARPRRPRLRRALAITSATVAVLAVALVVGVAWYFSDIALRVPDGPAPDSAVRVASAVAGEAIELERTPATETDGLHAVIHPGGWGVMSEEVARTGDRVIRAWRDVEGSLPEADTTGEVDSDAFVGDPGAVGLEFDDVVVPGELGDLPAWVVPGPEEAEEDTADEDAAGTWVVFVHGRGGSREESLRYLPLWHDLGHPVLVPTYRNDEGAPVDPRGWYGLGETEWRDADAAVGWALDNGAERVVLAGWSMGGAIVMQTLDRSDRADAVAAVVLDAPVLDWRDTFDHQGGLYGLPGWWTAAAVDLAGARAGIDFDDYDWVARADEVRDVPVYLVHSAGDGYVPNGPSHAFAEARPDIVTFVEPEGADHTREWNVDPEGYEADMRAWFETILAGAA